jgi:hypothetical protein
LPNVETFNTRSRSENVTKLLIENRQNRQKNMLMCLTLSFSDACFLTLGLRFNVRQLYRLAQKAKSMSSYAFMILGIFEVSWSMRTQLYGLESVPDVTEANRVLSGTKKVALAGYKRATLHTCAPLSRLHACRVRCGSTRLCEKRLRRGQIRSVEVACCHLRPQPSQDVWTGRTIGTHVNTLDKAARTQHSTPPGHTLLTRSEYRERSP